MIQFPPMQRRCGYERCTCDLLDKLLPFHHTPPETWGYDPSSSSASVYAGCDYAAFGTWQSSSYWRQQLRTSKD